MSLQQSGVQLHATSIREHDHQQYSARSSIVLRHPRVMKAREHLRFIHRLLLMQLMTIAMTQFGALSASNVSQSLVTREYDLKFDSQIFS